MATHSASEPLAPASLDLHLHHPGDKELLGKDHKLLNGCVPLSHQVAGHMYGKDKVGILQHPDGTVLKQLQPPPRGPRELDFYNTVFSNDCTDPKLRELQIFLPKYYGTWSPPGSANDLYLKLEDVTRKFNKPCIMDVKIGQKSYDPHASAEKIQQQISKYPLMEEIGFLVLGMRELPQRAHYGYVIDQQKLFRHDNTTVCIRSELIQLYYVLYSHDGSVMNTKIHGGRVYHMDSDSFETQNQHYGRSLTKDTIKHGLSKFFHNGCYLRKDAVSACLQIVQNILQWFENQNILHFYASSLLFVYDGSCPQPTPTVDGKVHEKHVATAELRTDDELTECNNNISRLSSMENGKNEMLVEKKRSRIYAANKKTCPKRLHSEAFMEGEILGEDRIRKNQNNVPQEYLNGNLLMKLENVICQVSPDLRDSAQVDVRMIDFAHVFPSEGKDLGYIYGLKNLISVLQSILNE